MRFEYDFESTCVNFLIHAHAVIWHDVFGAWDRNNNAYFDTVNSHTDTANFL